MRVKELIKVLKTLPPDAVIAMSSDPEGNSYGTLHDKSIFLENEVPIVVLAPYEEHLDLSEIPGKEK